MLRLLSYFKKRSERTTDNISKQEQLRRLQWDIVIEFNKKTNICKLCFLKCCCKKFVEIMYYQSTMYINTIFDMQNNERKINSISDIHFLVHSLC